MICEKCGAELRVGDYPFCPHGIGMTGRIHDDIPGGMWLENYGPHPVFVRSHTERRAIMQAQGIREKEEFAPMPGTDRDAQGIPNPAGYRSLDAAAIIARNGQRTSDVGTMGGSPIDHTDPDDVPNDPSTLDGRTTFTRTVRTYADIVDA